MVIVIASILAALATPSMVGFVRNNSLVASVNLFQAHIKFTRSEALTRNQVVTLCPDNGGVCGADWSQGLLVRDNAGNILKQVEGDAAKITITSTATFADGVSYNGRGLPCKVVGPVCRNFDELGLTPADFPIFAICDSRLEADGRQIEFNFVGTPTIFKAESRKAATFPAIGSCNLPIPCSDAVPACVTP